MEELLPVGTLVKLKSGGPVMTVSNTTKNSPVFECTWYQDGEYKTIKIMKKALKKVELEES